MKKYCLRVLKVFPLLLFGVAGFGVLNCSNDPNPVNTDYTRQPIAPSIDTVETNHPLCNEPQPAFSNQDECQLARKFKLHWEQPVDTVGLTGYRIYLDTSPYGTIPPGMSSKEIVTHSEWADVLISQVKGPVDSIIFAIGSGRPRPDSLNAAKPRILLLDTNGRVDSGKFVVAVYPVYNAEHKGVLYGLAEAKIGDIYPASPVRSEFEVFSRSIKLKWERPTDQISFFNSGYDSGIIQAYQLELTTTGGVKKETRAKALNPKLTYLVEGDTVATNAGEYFAGTDGKIAGMRFVIPDGGHFHHVRTHSQQDRLTLEIGNLTPMDTLEFNLFPIDLAGNKPKSQQTTSYRFFLTDTTEPTKPELVTDSTGITQNRLVYHWQASRDSMVNGDGQLEAGQAPDQGIREYHLRREMVQDLKVVSRIDSFVIAHSPTDTNPYRDTVKYLPPGTSYRITLQAIDSTGHKSQSDTLFLSTLDIPFSEAGTKLICPPGFLPVASRSFIMGDTANKPKPDEKPGHQKDKADFLTTLIPSFCMEPYEHRDSSGRFQNRVSWTQASKTCEELSPADSTQLCSEVQWERACKGGDSLLPLKYGFQGDGQDAGLLQSKCNQGTNDSLPASEFSLRNGRCLTNEGIYDLPGQYSEWVLDRYVDSAYTRLLRDTLPYSFVFQPTDSLAPHVFRGGNFLHPEVATDLIQSLARCSNRDTPREVRPKYKMECLDTVPMLLAVFSSTFADHHCMPLPRKSASASIVDIRALEDSLIRISYSTSGQIDTVKITRDSLLSTKRPIAVRLTEIALAAVQYVNAKGDTLKDTLDAKDLKGASMEEWGQVLKRESGYGYTPVQENGNPKIRFLFGFAAPSSRPARESYVSRAISFRCCAKPRMVVKDSIP